MEQHGDNWNASVRWDVAIKQQTVRKSTNNERYEAKTVTLDGAWARTSDQGGVMGGSWGETDSEGDDESGYGEGPPRRGERGDARAETRQRGEL